MMKLYMVYRLDRDDGRAAAIREATRPAHRAYMDQFAPRRPLPPKSPRRWN